MTMDPLFVLCHVNELPPGEMKAFMVQDERILLANVAGVFHAMGAVCTHECGYLDEGDLEDDTVVCPIHFARFSVVTGEVLDGPAETAEPVFSVVVRDDMVYIAQPGRDGADA